MYTIIGRGFGLYGYMPALLMHLNQKFVLQTRYKSTILSRPELAHFAESIEWAPDLENALGRVDSVIIATTPETQIEMIKRSLRHPNIQRFVLEKPLASSPQIASEVLSRLEFAEKELIVGYSLAHLNWRFRSPGTLWRTTSVRI